VFVKNREGEKPSVQVHYICEHTFCVAVVYATDQKLFYHSVLCNVGNSYLHCVGGNFHKPHGSNFPTRSFEP